MLKRSNHLSIAAKFLQVATPKNILVTGAAGFIGFHLSKRLCLEGYRVIGIDNMNEYYDVSLKKSRLAILKGLDKFHFEKIDLVDGRSLSEVVGDNQVQIIINLAAQAGVRYSIENPRAYIDSNLVGFANVLEAARQNNLEHLVFASSSSVYGANKKLPFSEGDNVDHPMSLYAATKKSNELMAHSYASLYNLPVTGLRFFTVYGPYGRPDMALFLFTEAILSERPIKVFNNGDLKRDFTFVDDIVEGIFQLFTIVPEADPSWNGVQPNPSSSYAPYAIYNIGNHQSIDLLRFINAIEENLGKKAIKEFYPMQPGDVKETYADIDNLTNNTGFKPVTSIEEGVGKFIDWYKEYYHVNTIKV